MAAVNTTVDMSIEDGVDLEFFDEVMGDEDLEAMRMRQEVAAKKKTDQNKKIEEFNKAWNITSATVRPTSAVDPLPSTSSERQVVKPEQPMVVVKQTPGGNDPRLTKIKSEPRKLPNPCAIAMTNKQANNGHHAESNVSEQDLYVVKPELYRETENIRPLEQSSSDEDSEECYDRRRVSKSRNVRRQRSRSPRYSRSPRRSHNRRRSRSYSRSRSRSRSRTPERYRRRRHSRDPDPLTAMSRSMQDPTMLHAMMPMMTMMMPMMAKLAASAGVTLPVPERTDPSVPAPPPPSTRRLSPIMQRTSTNRNAPIDITAQLFLEHKIDVAEFLAQDRRESDIRYRQYPSVSRKIQEAIDILDRDDVKLKTGKFLYVAPTYCRANIKNYTRSPMNFNGLNVLFATTSESKDVSPYDPFSHLNPTLRRMILMFGLDEGLIAKKIVTEKGTQENDASNERTTSGSTGRRCVIDRSTQTYQTQCMDCARRRNKPRITIGTQTVMKTKVAEVNTQTELSGVVSWVSLEDLLPSQVKNIKYLIKYMRKCRAPGSLAEMVHNMDTAPSEKRDQAFQDALECASEAAQQSERNANRYVNSFGSRNTFSRNDNDGDMQQGQQNDGQWGGYQDCNNFMPADYNDQPPPPKKKKRNKKRSGWMN